MRRRFCRPRLPGTPKKHVYSCYIYILRACAPAFCVWRVTSPCRRRRVLSGVGVTAGLQVVGVLFGRPTGHPLQAARQPARRRFRPVVLSRRRALETQSGHVRRETSDVTKLLSSSLLSRGRLQKPGHPPPPPPRCPGIRAWRSAAHGLTSPTRTATRGASPPETDDNNYVIKTDVDNIARNDCRGGDDDDDDDDDEDCNAATTTSMTAAAHNPCRIYARL